MMVFARRNSLNSAISANGPMAISTTRPARGEITASADATSAQVVTRIRLVSCGDGDRSAK